MENKEVIYNSRKLENSKIWLLFLFFGWSYGSMDKIGKQILFYCTVGGFGLWTLYVLFTLNKKINEHNKKIALQCGFEVTDLLKHGLV
tara:strand:- start:795 stop:1058 length:264 start_codon:yes stop_codon:yes gene_type:complete